MAWTKKAWLLSMCMLVAAVEYARAADDDDNGGDDDDGDEVPSWIANGGFMLLVVALFAMFWGLAVVVEEFFVPALNVMCVEAGIPDDVAGATFMAAGASSPEMFASFISLFITHSALGAGTIIGSEIFNHLIICAGSVLYSKNGEIQLEPRILMREVTFYALALGLLVYALSVSSETSNRCERYLDDEMLDDDQGFFCIDYTRPIVLLCGYALYALVCSYYTQLMGCFCPLPNMERVSTEDPDVRDSLAKEPLANFSLSQAERDSMSNRKSQQQNQSNPLHSGSGNLEVAPPEVSRGTTGGNSLIRGSSAIANDMTRRFLSAAAPDYVRTGALADVHDVDQNEEAGTFSCYLWKKSKFYSKMLNHPKAWQLRWCTVDKNGFRSCRDRDYPNQHVRAFNVYEATKVDIIDVDRCIFKLYCPTGDLTFQAPDSEVLQMIRSTLDTYLQEYKSKFDENSRTAIRRASMKNPLSPVDEVQAVKSVDKVAMELSHDDDDEEDVEDMLEWPHGIVSQIVHIVLLPIKVSMYYTTPDVRRPGRKGMYPVTIAMCFFWLAMFSFVMTECLETLGALVGISPIVMGITFSAAGTSFPNVFASMVVARQGLGNCAVSNALGGNVFNVFMGLGLPWFFYNFVGTDDVSNFTFYGMAAGGVIFPVIILAALLVFFVILLLISGWKLLKWHAYLFLALYVVFLIWIFTGEDSPHAFQ